MLRQLRSHIVTHLWNHYRHSSLHADIIENAFAKKNILPVLDHFAMIDLPSKHSGISSMKKLFSLFGYIEEGQGYLPDKQNDFLWMTEINCMDCVATSVLPQVVVADFRLEELPNEVKIIIEKYASYSKPLPENRIRHYIERILLGEENIIPQLIKLILNYCLTKPWPMPSVREFALVQEWNELLAWVLVFGHQPNHFALSIHLLPDFSNLNEFHQFVQTELKLPLNAEGGTIKGNEVGGIAQGATQGIAKKIALADGHITIPTDFIEFVWRFPLHPQQDPQPASPLRWKDYFTGFIAQQADSVIESLYEQI